MSNDSSGSPQLHRPGERVGKGVSVFGAIMLITAGLFQFFEGLSAAQNDTVYESIKDYAYRMDISGWGWTHMIIGGAAFVVGVAILAGQTWAMTAGMVLAGLSAVTNFLFLPYYPTWSMTIIAVDVVVIWALSTRLPEF